MKNTKISQILNRLMDEKKIRVTELARQVNLPQPTVHRIATGACEHPHLSTLEPIANYFSISVDQIKGHEPIQWLDHVIRIPLLDWEEVVEWPINRNQIGNKELILTDAKVGPNGYAVRIYDSSMEPVFSKTTILIADPDKQIRDRCYVIAKLSEIYLPIFRQLLIDACAKYLKPLSPDFEQYKMTKLGKKDNILGVIVQAKRNYDDF